MKYVSILLLTLVFFSFKNDTQKPQEDGAQQIVRLDKNLQPFEEVLPFNTLFNTNDAELSKTKSTAIKKQSLIDRKDEKVELKKLVLQKTFKKMKRCI